jgi:DNA-binding response OmpR family regulator
MLSIVPAASAVAAGAHAPRSVADRLLLFIGHSVRPDADTAALLGRCHARPVCIGAVQQALRAATQLAFDGAVIDAALLRPSEDAWVSRLRQRLHCPLLVIADRADEVDEIVALEQGADDYLVRPLSGRLLSARLQALLRPSAPRAHEAQPAAAPELRVGDWRLEPALRRLCKGEQVITLTEMLASLLATLFEHQDRVVTREQLLAGLRALGSHTDARGVSTYLHRLRRLLDTRGVCEFEITSLSGRGYLLRSRPGPAAHASQAA